MKTSQKVAEKTGDESLLKKGKKQNSCRYKPMLATLVDKPFDEPGWVYD
jgi:hypothetical protein